MNVWQILSYAAWAVAVLLLLWILVDAWRVSREYDDDFLMSSTEGEE